MNGRRAKIRPLGPCGKATKPHGCDSLDLLAAVVEQQSNAVAWKRGRVSQHFKPCEESGLPDECGLRTAIVPERQESEDKRVKRTKQQVTEIGKPEGLHIQPTSLLSRFHEQTVLRPVETTGSSALDARLSAGGFVCQTASDGQGCGKVASPAADGESTSAATKSMLDDIKAGGPGMDGDRMEATSDTSAKSVPSGKVVMQPTQQLVVTQQQCPPFPQQLPAVVPSAPVPPAFPFPTMMPPMPFMPPWAFPSMMMMMNPMNPALNMPGSLLNPSAFMRAPGNMPFPTVPSVRGAVPSEGMPGVPMGHGLCQSTVPPAVSVSSPCVTGRGVQGVDQAKSNVRSGSSTPVEGEVEVRKTLALLDLARLKQWVLANLGEGVYLMFLDVWRTDSPHVRDAVWAFKMHVLNQQNPDFRAFLVSIFGLDRLLNAASCKVVQFKREAAPLGTEQLRP